MRKIGFLDYYIDQWHAHAYPDMIRQSTLGSEFQVTLAYEKTPKPGKMSIDEYCAKQGIVKAGTIEQVVNECDAIIVLAPRDAELHEELAQLPLASGMPVYIDKPIAPDLATAKRLFERAKHYKTPMFSSSALRFAPGLIKLIEEMQSSKSDFVSTLGGGVFEIYAIHQFEMIVATMGIGGTRIMQVGTRAVPSLSIEYPGGRRALMSVVENHDFHLSTSWLETAKRHTRAVVPVADFFPPFIEAVLKFFVDGDSPVEVAQTLEVAALVEAGTKSLGSPGEWIELPR